MKKHIIFLTLVFISLIATAQDLIWAKSIGSTSYDAASSISVEASGNIYTAGTFQGTVDFDPGTGTNYLTSAGFTDVFILKMDASGNFLWARNVGGSLVEFVSAITSDLSGNTYVTGGFNGTADFDPGAGTYNLTSAGQTDIFILKLNSAGNFVWAKKFGAGTYYDMGSSISSDQSGNTYTSGYFQGTVDFDPGSGIFNLTSAGASDIFILKMDNSGNFIWAKSIGGAADDYGNSISIGPSGYVYATGFFSGTADFDPGIGTNILTAAGYRDIFVLKLDASGNLVWAKKLGGGSYEEGKSIAVDQSGNSYITGYFEGTCDFDPGTGTYNLTAAVKDIFISKLDVSGNFVWAKSMVGNSDNVGCSIVVDLANNIYSTGYFQGTVDFDPGPDTCNITSCGIDDSFISLLDSSGTFIGAKSICAENYQNGYSIVIDQLNNVYTAGRYRGTADFDPGSGICNYSSVGEDDIYILKLKSSMLIDMQPASVNNVCPGTATQFTVSGEYITDYQWQSSTDGGVSFDNLSDGAIYTGSQTSTLNVNVNISMDSVLFRCVVSNDTNMINSNAAILTLETQPPAISCPANITLDNDAGQCSAKVTFLTPYATDNCTSTPLNLFGNAVHSAQYTGYYTLGYAFTPNVDITVKGFRRYFGSMISLWNSSGELLGSQSVSGTDESWTVNNLSVPIHLSAGQTYIIAAFANFAPYYVKMFVGETFTDVTFLEGRFCSGSDFPTGIGGGLTYFVDMVYTKGISISQIAGLPFGSDFPVGTTTNTFEASDLSGNTDTCSFDVTVNYTYPLVYTCPGDINVNNEAGQCSASVTYPEPSASNDCPLYSKSNILGNPVHTNYQYDDLTVGYSFIPNSDVTVTAFRRYFGSKISIWTDAGILLGSQAVSGDFGTWTENPLSSPIHLTAGQTYRIGAYTNSYYGYYTSNLNVDFSDGVIVQDYYSTGDAFPTLSNGVHWWLVDLVCTKKFNSVTQVAGLPSGSVFPVGTTANVFILSDSAGNTDTCSFDISVNDTEPMVLNCPADIHVNNDAEQTSAVVTYTSPFSTENCHGPSSAILGNVSHTNQATADYTLGYSFTPDTNIIVTGFRRYFGSKISLWNDDGTLIHSESVTGTNAIWTEITLSSPIHLTAGETYRIAAYSNNSTYYSATGLGSGFTDGTILQDYYGIGDIFPTSSSGIHWWFVDMVYSKDISSLQIAGLPSGSAFPIGTTVNTFIATDWSGDTDTCSFNVIVTAVHPVITCPPGIVQAADAGLCEATIAIDSATATDIYQEDITIEAYRSDSLPLAAPYPIGVTTITWIATDETSNTSSCTQTITITDNQPPVFNCPGDIVVSNDTGQCNAIVSFLTPIATDNCILNIDTSTILGNIDLGGEYSADLTLGYSFTPNTDITVIAFHRYFGSKYSIWTDNGTLLYTQATPGPSESWTVIPLTSPLHLTAGQTYRVGAYTNNSWYRWGNNGAPTFPDGIINSDYNAAGDSFPIDTGGAHWYLVDLIYTKSFTHAEGRQIAGLPSGSVYPLGTTTNVFVIEDMSGNDDTCSFNVTVNDTEPPEYDCSANIYVNTDAGQCHAVVSYSLPTATDNCFYPTTSEILGNAVPTAISHGDVTLGYSFTPNKDITVTAFRKYAGSKISLWTDGGELLGSENVATPYTFWTVTNLSTPIELQGGQTYRIGVYTGTINYYYYYQTNFGTSFADGTIVQSYHGSGDIFPTDPDGTQWYFVDLVYTKGMSGTQIAGLPPGSDFPIGTTNNIFVVEDNEGNTDTCSFNVVVYGAAAPVLNCPANITQTADAGFCGAALTINAPIATDSCGETVTIAGIRSDSLLLTDDYPVGITTITWTATDASGNISSCTQNITITDDQYPVISCPGNVNTSNDPGLCTAIVNYTVTASDNCDEIATSNILGNVNPATVNWGSYTLGYSFTPNSNIIVTGFRKFFGTKFTIWTNEGVLLGSDTINPSAGAWHNIPLSSPVYLYAGETYRVSVFSGSSPYSVYFSTSFPGTSFTNGTINQGYSAPGDTFPTTSDNVKWWMIDLIYTKISGPQQTAGIPSGSAFPLGTTTNTFTASDIAGNTVTCSFDVTVTDDEKPVLNCPNDISVYNESGQCSAVVSYPEVTATDNDTLSQPGHSILGYPSNNFFNAHGDFTVGYSFTPTMDITVIAFNGYVGRKFSLWTDDGVLLASESGNPNGWTQIPLTYPVHLTAGETYIIGCYTNNGPYCYSTTPGNTCPDAVINMNYTSPGDSFPATPDSVRRYFVDLIYSYSVHVDQIAGLPSGSTFPGGITTNVYVATDNSGNIDTCSFNVIVLDTIPPIHFCPNDTTVNSDPGECTSVVTYVNPSTIDNCLLVTNSSILENVSHNYYTNPYGGTYGFAFTPDKDLTVTALRRYCGEKISIWTDSGLLLYSDTVSGVNGTWTETPLSSPINLSAGQTYRIGTYVTSGYIYCITDHTYTNFEDGVILLSYNGGGDTFPTMSNSTTMWLVDLTYSITNPQQVSGLPSGSEFPAGTTNNVFVTTYITGATDTCSFSVTVTVNEDIPPEITCPANQTIYISGNDSSYTVQGTEFDPVSIFDNCGVAGFTNSINGEETLDEAALPIGTTTINWYVTDYSGNSDTCSFNVNVISTAGINNLQYSKISVYPNPFTDEFYINCTGDIIRKIKVTDLTGKTIMEEDNLPSQVKINLSGVSKGLYLVHVQTKNFIFTEKLIKN